MGNKKKKVTKSEVTKKKITFASAILLVIGSSIGAGIFLKNGEVLGNVGGSAILALVSWVLSIFGVICMGVSLAEIASASTDSNLGIISWVKNFCHKYLYKVSKYFMAFIYLPLNFFLMPYYVVIQFQDAFGWQTQWWVSALIAFGITAWFFIASGLSSRLGDVQNKVLTYVKFVPLAFCIVAGITVACMGYGAFGDNSQTEILPSVWSNFEHTRLVHMFPMLGIIGSIPAIIFSYDGFYSAAGIQSEMEEPKKTPVALVIGLLIVSGINLLIAISLLLGSGDGRVNALGWFYENPNWHWVIGVMQILIAIGVMGIINGFAIYNPLYYQDLIKGGELPFADKLKSKIAKQKHNWVGLIYAGVITLAFFIIFTLIGALAYSDTIGYGSTTMVPFITQTINPDVLPKGYDAGGIVGNCNSLYSFCDLMANWTSLFAFLCVVFATVGAMKNRKTNKVKVMKVKGFWFCSIVSTIVISIAVLFVVVAAVTDIALVNSWKSDIGKVIDDVEYTKEAWNTDMLGAIMTLVMLIVFVLACCIPSSIEMHKEKKMHLNRASR